MFRRCREELERQRTEERARQQAEAQRLIKEKIRREEEEQRQAEEERAQALREAALLQKQVGKVNPSHKNCFKIPCFASTYFKRTLGFVLVNAARGGASQGAGQGGADPPGARTPRSEGRGGPPSQKEGDD